MTKAVEQRLASIIATPWMMLKQSFRNFLQRKPVSQTPVEECRAKDTVCNLTEDYLIIQGPPGTGKTWLGMASQLVGLRGIWAFMNDVSSTPCSFN